ncbi:hypothetical protein [Phaeovulum sp.]|uniref:hypothetical protein n=1 Tax=Phaeovulum sp. TaxID=2934796 RepID=UPI00356761A4
MSAYFQQFRIVGEVAEMVLLQEPSRRLLVDISFEPLLGRMNAPRRNLATITITDDDMIGQFLREVSVGDVTAANGTFQQTDYVPHKTTCIDTTFLVTDFQKLDLDDIAQTYEPRATERPRHVTLH